MTVLEQADSWTHVQVEDGKDGWVLNQFLQNKVPDSIELEKLKKTHAALVLEAETLRKNNQDLSEKVDKLTADLTQRQNEFESANNAYETLKKESASFLELQADLKKTSESLREQKEKADRLENELSSLYNDKRLKWFGLGAGVLFVGIMIGFITKPQRRRSALL